MAPDTQELIPREPRHLVQRFRGVRVQIERLSEPVPTAVTAELLDLSVQGAKLQIPCSLRFHERLVLRLNSNEREFALAVETSVRWIRSAENGTWTFGCAFEPRLPAREMEALFDHGLLERRKYERIPISVPALAYWELDPQPTTVQLVDLSHGGFCLLTSLQGKIGARVRLSVNKADGNPAEIIAAARWESVSSEGRLIGCEFLKEGYGLLRGLTQGFEATPAIRRSPWRVRWLAIAATVLAMLWLAFSIPR